MLKCNYSVLWCCEISVLFLFDEWSSTVRVISNITPRNWQADWMVIIMGSRSLIDK